ncbi:MAG TPA: hypothetical protein VD835_17830 [Pyrinomonadaceae bacterium]|nr:hypothetical protein [Pyrinomonadaceae bacterium]
MQDEHDEQGETFNQDQQEMFQNPDTHLGETRQRTPGTENVSPSDDEESSGDSANRQLDNPNLI